MSLAVSRACRIAPRLHAALAGTALTTILAAAVVPGIAVAQSKAVAQDTEVTPVITMAPAQDSQAMPPSSAQALVPATSPTPAPAGTSLESDADKFKRFDKLAEPGLTTTFPGSGDTLLGDIGGFRTWLAEHEIGLQARAGFVGVYNPLDKGQPRSPQRYNGQRPTVQTQSLNIIATMGLKSIGLPNSKIILGGNYLVTTFYPNGPNTVGFRNIAFYQSFADGKIEFKAGIMPEYYEFVGFYAGGTPVLASGVTGLIPIQAGLSADPAPTPAANLTFHFKKGAYFKTAVQRSTAPAGTPYELQHNGPNVAFKMKDAGPLFIGEVGIRRAATGQNKQVWVRAGGLYNDSNYTRFDGAGTASNHSIYAAADFQVTQPDLTLPGKGFYVGGSGFWAPDNVNRITQTYEARIYQIAPFESRPLDSAALRVGYNRYSSDGQRATEATGGHANGHQLSVTGSYSLHVTKGLFFTPAAAYIKNPSPIGDFNDALSLSATIYALF
ncbi:carbohydrate porin [Novosphingobium sp. AP12]|uniref:carbohydrate porin n=1 Tax=Novosphingobium sp. AP12 TaxID=1144305 RepID=UPI0002720FE2|nr:carbohydrate porin [Novosphingobium sp. AP12]EJL30478.1 carbohydrate-selective porin [Novosphingobium sp. AP12]